MPKLNLVSSATGRLILLSAIILFPGSALSQTPEWLAKLLRSVIPADLLTPTDKTTTTASTVGSEVESLLATSSCELPQTLAKQLGRKPFVPDDLGAALRTQRLQDTSIQKVQGLGIRGVLHTVSIIDPSKQDQPPQHIRLVGATTYASVDPSSLIDPNADNLMFTLDCTGYLNAALSTQSNIPGAEIQLAARAARNTSRSMLIVRARVFSPVAIALNPALAPANYQMSSATRADILFSAANEAAQSARDITDSFLVVAWRQQDLLWMSNRGSSALQGSGSFTANSAAGLGVVSLQGSVDAGVRASREVRFAAFDTYMLEKVALQSVVKTYGMLREELTQLIARSQAYDRIKTEGGGGRSINFYFNTLPQRVCELHWVPEEKAEQNQVIGAIVGSWSEGVCKLSFVPQVTQMPAGMLRISATSGLTASQPHVFKLTLQLP